ncbi:SDR family oxidoreductase [Mesorhizobium sp. CN2-181]|uniref:SDR family oxidoreductase n=1 Tax=Mesorhizobium yinganensis TaxID=3157707 RepID=UPI0032B7AC00
MARTAGRLANKVIIVTGAAKGIGNAIARCVSREGATVVLTDIDGERARDAVVLLGDGCIFMELDVADQGRFDSVAAETLTRFGRIDGLVNNAGINVKYEPLAMPDAEWHRCLNINLKGQWNGCRAVLPTMVRQQAGAIVNISSVHGHQIVPASFPYPVSKSAILGLTRALGVEYAPNNIRVNSISPGYVDTDLLQDYFNSLPDPDSARRSTDELIPARRVCRPDEVGMTTVFLLSDEAPYIAGSDIVIDGGRLAMYHN